MWRKVQATGHGRAAECRARRCDLDQKVRAPGSKHKMVREPTPACEAILNCTVSTNVYVYEHQHRREDDRGREDLLVDYRGRGRLLQAE